MATGGSGIQEVINQGNNPKLCLGIGNDANVTSSPVPMSTPNTILELQWHGSQAVVIFLGFASFVLSTESHKLI